METIGRSSFSLTMAPPHSDLRVEKIVGDTQLTRRIAEVGITPGSSIQVVQRNGQALIVKRGELRLALGGGMAQRIFVSQVLE